MSYQLEGRFLEVCTCKSICPCFVGEDPDGGECGGTIAYRIDKGTINEINVSGLTLAMVAYIPGNAFNGNWRAVLFIDDRATEQQQEALLSAFTGKEGGPLTDIAELVGEVVSVERATIESDIHEGTGLFKVGDVMRAEMESLKGASEKPVKLYDAAIDFSPGAPSFPGKAKTYHVSCPSLDMEIDLQAHNSMQAYFKFQT
jgi:hypothetical protein